MRNSASRRIDASRERRSRETSSLWQQVAASQSEEERGRLREEVILLNISVALAIAGRYRSRGIMLDDLEQVACLGLVKAAKGFDPGAGKDFLTYAVPTISGEVKRYFRDHGWTVRPPRRIQELQARISSISEDSAQSLGRPARPAEIAARLGVDVSDVIEALTCTAFSPVSLDTPLGEPGSSASLGDLLGSDREDCAEVEDTIVLTDALRTLSSRDLLLLRRRFCEERSQRQIGEEFGMSQVQVSRLQARILARLRALVELTDADLERTA